MTHRLRGDTSASSDPVVRAAAKSDRRSFAFGTRIKVESGRRRLRKRSTLFPILTPTLYLQRALISHWAAAKSVKHCAAPFLSHHWRWVRHRGSNRCHYLLNWLGHASPSPSYLYLYSLHFTSASMSLHFYLLKCFIVHTSFFHSIEYNAVNGAEFWRQMLISSGEIHSALSSPQICRFSQILVSVGSKLWGSQRSAQFLTMGRVSLAGSLLTVGTSADWREEGRVEDVRSVGMICSTVDTCTLNHTAVERNREEIKCRDPECRYFAMLVTKLLMGASSLSSGQHIWLWNNPQILLHCVFMLIHNYRYDELMFSVYLLNLVCSKMILH